MTYPEKPPAPRMAPEAPRWAWWAATGLGSGRLKPAPGTWGSLAGGAAWLALVCAARHFPQAAFECLLGCAAMAMVFLSIAASGMVARQSGESDPSYIVSDEWAGVWLALWPVRRHAARAIASGGSWKLAIAGMLAAFLLFRLFDVWKPWPIRRLEALPGGWGITLDDVAAGIFAGLLLHCAMAFLPYLSAACQLR